MDRVRVRVRARVRVGVRVRVRARGRVGGRVGFGIPSLTMRGVSALDDGRELRVANARLPGVQRGAGSGA